MSMNERRFPELDKIEPEYIDELNRFKKIKKKKYIQCIYLSHYKNMPENKLICTNHLSDFYDDYRYILCHEKCYRKTEK